MIEEKSATITTLLICTKVCSLETEGVFCNLYESVWTSINHCKRIIWNKWWSSKNFITFPFIFQRKRRQDISNIYDSLNMFGKVWRLRSKTLCILIIILYNSITWNFFEKTSVKCQRINSCIIKYTCNFKILFSTRNTFIINIKNEKYLEICIRE